MGLLQDKVVIITGAGRGIGRSEALACAAAGAKLIVNDLGCDLAGEGQDASVAAAVVDEIRASAGLAEASCIDVAASGAADALVQKALLSFGHVDGVICNAGIERDASFLRADPGDEQAVVEVHTLSAMRLARSAAKRMLEQRGGGSIVLTTGAASFFGARNQTASCTAGAGVVGFVRAAAVELKRHDIRINALAPVARTRMTQALPMFANLRPTSMTPEQVAPVATFLLSDLARSVTGEAVGVAGGRVYAYRVRETSGTFLEEDQLTPEKIASAWDAIARV